MISFQAWDLEKKRNERNKWVIIFLLKNTRPR